MKKLILILIISISTGVGLFAQQKNFLEYKSFYTVDDDQIQIYKFFPNNKVVLHILKGIDDFDSDRYHCNGIYKILKDNKFQTEVTCEEKEAYGEPINILFKYEQASDAIISIPPVIEGDDPDEPVKYLYLGFKNKK